MSMTGTAKYGDKHWCVETSDGDEIYLMADIATVYGDGSIVFSRTNGDINYAVASKNWLRFWNESMIEETENDDG